MTLKIYVIRRKSYPKYFLSKLSYSGREWTQVSENVDVWTHKNGAIQAMVYLNKPSCDWNNNIKYEDCELVEKEIEL